MKMKLEKIETGTFEVIKVARAEEVEKATEAGWKLLGVLNQEGIDSRSSYGPITHPPLFVLGKATDSVVAKAMADVTKAAVDVAAAQTEAKKMTDMVELVRRHVGARTPRKCDKDSLVRTLDSVRAFVGIRDEED